MDLLIVILFSYERNEFILLLGWCKGFRGKIMIGVLAIIYLNYPDVWWHAIFEDLAREQWHHEHTDFNYPVKNRLVVKNYLKWQIVNVESIITPTELATTTLHFKAIKTCDFCTPWKQWWFLKIFARGALGTTTPIVWVWPSYNHAHIFIDGNMII